jgi:hypothetical protein
VSGLEFPQWTSVHCDNTPKFLRKECTSKNLAGLQCCYLWKHYHQVLSNILVRWKYKSVNHDLKEQKYWAYMFEKPIKIDQEISGGTLNHWLFFTTFWGISTTLSIQSTPIARKSLISELPHSFHKHCWYLLWSMKVWFFVHKFKRTLIWIAVLINNCLITNHSILESLWGDMNTAYVPIHHEHSNF